MSLLSLCFIIILLGASVSAPPPATTPAKCPESEGMKDLLKRLAILEKLVRDIKGQCTQSCCGNMQGGADDPSSLKPPPCAKKPEDDCPGGCGGDARGTCVDGQCHCKEGFMGEKCELKTCPEDCNDQGRCVDGRCICFAGYSGFSCGTKTCPNNCHNNGHCQDGVCVCDPGFDSVDCGTRVCPKNCLNRGRCENGICICHEGYAGVDCGSRSCLNNCNARGDCEDGVCVCDTGFTGVDCGSKTCLHDCYHNGRCVDGLCVCDPGYMGEDCRQQGCHDDCNEQGKCVSGRCICDPGFIGPDCATKICSPECERRGRCEDGECICDPGFTGPDCESRACPSDCHRQGRCDDGTCICYPGYTGLDCAVKACPNKCNNRGRCQNGICICNAGFSGPDCGSRACPKNCSGNGKCVNGKCICNAGFIGPVCGTRACPEGCGNHGRCIRGSCVCSPGYTGVDCSIRTCPRNCNDRGRCEGGVCFCNSGFTGLDCGTKRCPSDCYDRGQCEDGVCVCDYGFTGRDCGIRTCPNDCYDHGHCQDGVCICDYGYQGVDCGIRTCPNNCYDQGQCLDGTCVCNQGYKGEDCSIRTCPNDCHDQGRCEDGVCICEYGFTGPDCRSRSCPNNCYNRGQCQDGHCICDSGYAGVDCATRACPKDCNERGTCDDGKCICNTGYTGLDCGSRSCPNDCNRRGQCEDGICRCDPGYTDIDCGLRTCPNSCHSRGQCDDGVCVCNNGYTGPDCGQRTCPRNCHNRGRCDNGKCICESGYIGVDCGSLECPGNCYGQGQCEDGICICNPGFTGPDCSSKACPKNCNDNGECVNGRCVCDAGYAGPVCGARVCLNNCNRRGKCVNGVCICKKGYSGPDCGDDDHIVDIGAVTGLQVTQQEESSITLGWDQPQNQPDSYDITFQAKKENGVISSTIEGSLTTYQQTGLAPGEEYIVNIQPRKGSTLGPETSITAKTRIECPRGLRVTEATFNSLFIKWERPQTLPDRYIVTLIYPNGKERKMKVPGKGDRIKVPGLEADTEYSVILRAERGQEQCQDIETTGVTAGEEKKRLNVEETTKDSGSVGTSRVINTTRTTIHRHGYVPSEPKKQLPGGGEGVDVTKESQEIITKGKNGTKVIQTKRNITTIVKTIYQTHRFRNGKLVDVQYETEDSDADLNIPDHGQVEVTIDGDDDENDYDYLGNKRRDSKGNLPGRKVEKWIMKNITHVTSSKESPTYLEGEMEDNLQRTITHSKVQIPGRERLAENSNVAKKLLEMEMARNKNITKSGNDGKPQKVHLEDPSQKSPLTVYEKRLDSSESETPLETSEEGSLETYDPSDPTKSRKYITTLIKINRIVTTTKQKTMEGDEYGGVHNRTVVVEQPDGIKKTTVKTKNQTKTWGPNIKSVIDNLPEKLSLYNGTFIQRLESYLRATAYPIKGNQTVESVAKAIFLYLIKVKPDSFTGMVYDRLPQKTPAAKGFSEPDGASLLQGNIGTSMTESREQDLDNTAAQTREGSPLVGGSSKRTVSVAPSSKKSEKVKTVGERTTMIEKYSSSSEVKSVDSHEITKDRVINIIELDPHTSASSKPMLDKGKGPQKHVSPSKKPTIAVEHHKSIVVNQIPGSGEEQGKEGPIKSPTISKTGPGAQGRPSIQQRSPTSLVISLEGLEFLWDKIIISYSPWPLLEGTIPQKKEFGKDLRQVEIQDLTPGTRYRFYLHGLVKGRSSKSYTLVAETASLPTTSAPPTSAPPTQAQVKVTTPPPPPPTSKASPVTPGPRGPLGGLQVRNITSDSITLVWKARPNFFESFLIRYEDVTNGGGSKETSVPGKRREETLSDLTQNTRYAILLYGIRGGKLSQPLEEEATTDASKHRGNLPRLMPISVSEVQPDSFRLKWDSVDGDFDAYVIQYGTSGGPPKEETIRGDQKTYLATGLVAEANYTVEIRGVWEDSHSTPEITHVFTGKAPPPLLESISPSDIRSSSVHLSWEVKGGDFDSFVLYYRDGEGQPQEVPLEGDVRSHDVKELKPGKKYKFTLYGLINGKRGKPVTTEITTEKFLPPRLESFSASDLLSESLRLSWEVLGGDFDSFLLLYRDAVGKPREVTLDGKQRTTPVEDLKPGKKYKFTLYGVSEGKKSKAAVVETSTVPKKPAPTAAPSPVPRLVTLVATEEAKDSVKLSWEVQGKVPFDWIVLQYREPEGSIRELRIPGQETSTVIQGLLPSKKYEFSAHGIRGDKSSKPLSTEFQIDFQEVGRPILTDLYISPHGPHAIHLSWEVPKGSFDSFKVRYGVQGQDGSVNTATADGADRNLLLSGLQPDTLYSVTLHGIREGTEQSSLEATGRTGPLDLEPPKNLRFSNVAEKSVTATWDPPNAETTTFKVSHQPADGGEPESITVVGPSTSIKRLTPGTQYEVTVVSVRGFEESPPLTDIVTTAGGGPRNLRAHDVTEVSALLRWEAPVGPVDKYLVTYRAENIPLITLPVPGDKTELPLSGLHPHTEYDVSVQSSHGPVTSAPTSTSFTTSADAPRDLTATQITARSALLNWKAPGTVPSGYILIYQAPQGDRKEIHLRPNLTSLVLSQLDPSTQYRVQLHALRNGASSVPISTIFTTSQIKFQNPRDCWEQRMNGEVRNGLFTINTGGDPQSKLTVYCDMETDGGGWIVFQRRMDGSLDFYRDWADYKNGFGNLTSEFWMGNIALHQITSLGPYELRVDLHAGNESAYAVYDDFRVEGEDQQFKLRLGQYKGTAGDSMSYHNNMVFSTRDRDTQKRILPCAMSYKGAWWYRNCHYANLNGIYGNDKDHQGINWHTWKGFEFSIPFTEMKMRPRGVGNRRRL
ncbi:tenascin-X [Gastrophryne carolinensis]